MSNICDKSLVIGQRSGLASPTKIRVGAKSYFFKSEKSILDAQNLHSGRYIVGYTVASP